MDKRSKDGRDRRRAGSAQKARREAVRTMGHQPRRGRVIARMLPIRDRCNDAGVCEDGLLTTFKHANVLLIIGFFGLYLASTAAWSARWRALLKLASVDSAFRAAWRVTLEAQAGGVLLPGGVGGDALRVAYVKERVPSASVAKVAASIMADRILGLVTLALLALGLALLFDPGKDMRVAMPMLAGIPLGAAVGWTLLRLLVKRSWLAEGRSRFLQGRLARRSSSRSSSMRRRRLQHPSSSAASSSASSSAPRSSSSSAASPLRSGLRRVAKRGSSWERRSR